MLELNVIECGSVMFCMECISCCDEYSITYTCLRFFIVKGERKSKKKRRKSKMTNEKLACLAEKKEPYHLDDLNGK